MTNELLDPPTEASADLLVSDDLLTPYQIRWIKDDSDLKIWEKSRRIGATTAESVRIAETRLTGRKTSDYWFSSRDESSAREFIEELQEWAGKIGEALEIVSGADLFPDVTDQKILRIDFPPVNGKACKAVAMASSPARFRSKGGDVGLDEFAYHKKPRAMYAAATPVTTWGDQLSILSSHDEDTTMFCELREMAQRVEEGQSRPGDIKFSRHHTDIYEAIDQGLVELINRVKGTRLTRAGFLADLRAKYPADVFAKEFECKPGSQSGSYLPYDLTRACVSRRAATPVDSVAALVADIAKRCTGASALYAGVDIGRTTDRFTIWVIAKVGGAYRTVGLLVWQGRSFAEMKAAVTALMTQWFDASEPGEEPNMIHVNRCVVDASGIGMNMAEDLDRARGFGHRIEAATTTSAFKTEIITLSRSVVEERRIELPDCPIVLADLASVRKVTTSAGNVRFDFESTKDGHADRLNGLARALHAAETRTSRFHEVNVPDGGGGLW